MKKLKYIAFVALPTLIREGITSVLKSQNMNFKTYNFENFQELSAFHNKLFVNLIMLNSDMPEYELKQINNLKKEIPKANWVGIITNNPNRNFTIYIENIVYLNDNTQKIFGIIKNILVDKISENKTNNNTLSEREIDVLKLLVKGKMNKEIADELNISIHTIITHRKNITHKLGIKSVAAMVIYAVANNIIDINDSIDLV